MRANDNSAVSDLFVEALSEIIRGVVREEIQAAIGNRSNRPEVEAKAKPYLTVKQAAENSGLGASTIRLLIRKRQLRAQKVGRRVLIKRSDLESFLEANPIATLPDKNA